MLKNEFESCYRQGDYEAIAAYKVDNAVIMAAGFASRFAPLSEITPKALLKVKGEIMIERQIRQLRDAGIPDIYVVVGYKKEMFYYLEEKYDVHIIETPIIPRGTTILLSMLSDNIWEILTSAPQIIILWKMYSTLMYMNLIILLFI